MSYSFHELRYRLFGFLVIQRHLWCVVIHLLFLDDDRRPALCLDLFLLFLSSSSLLFLLFLFLFLLFFLLLFRILLLFLWSYFLLWRVLLLRRVLFLRFLSGRTSPLLAIIDCLVLVLFPKFGITRLRYLLFLLFLPWIFLGS